MALIIGTKKKETLPGTAFDDTILGLGGNDILKGLAGNDKLDGGTGNDKLFGGAGRDTLKGGAGNDFLDGGKNDDKLLDGGAGNDTVLGGLGKDNLKGGAGDDVLEGGAGADKMDGGGGTDTVSYEHSASGLVAHLQLTFDAGVPLPNGEALGDTYVSIENLRGSNFDDLLIGNDAANNKIEGLGGDDVLAGFNGNDSLFGGLGNDTLSGDEGADILDGGDGTDWATYEFSPGGVTASLIGPLPLFNVFNTADAAGDTYVSIENLRGSNFADLLIGNHDGSIIEGLAGDDYLAGGESIDTLIGGDGNDTLEGHFGADVLNGGAGSDTASYETTFELTGFGVTALLGAINGFTNNGDATGDTYISIENLRGSNTGDFLVGDSGANKIEGLIGDDFIAGAGGADILTGGTGADTFIYGPLSEIGDTITDFDVAVDKIAVLTPTSNPNVGGFLPGHATGAILATELVHNTVVGAFAQFLIDDTNGDLFYDADGTGGNAQILVAHLTGINAVLFSSGNIEVL